MKEHPILFSGPMIRRLLQKQKWQTRRAVKWLIEPSDERRGHMGVRKPTSRYTFHVPKAELAAFLASQNPFGQRGDRLWVRETSIISPKRWTSDWALIAKECRREDDEGDIRAVQYLASSPDTESAEDWGLKKTPSIFMPRWASRITLEVTEVRVERLQDISDLDARAEGAVFHDGRGVGHSGWRHDEGEVHNDPVASFRRLWGDINGPESWAANPWVWVVSFKDSRNSERGEKQQQGESVHGSP